MIFLLVSLPSRLPEYFDLIPKKPHHSLPHQGGGKFLCGPRKAKILDLKGIFEDNTKKAEYKQRSQKNHFPFADSIAGIYKASSAILIAVGSILCVLCG